MSVEVAPDLGIAHLAASYRDGSLAPADVCAGIRERAAGHASRNVWIRLLDEAEQRTWLDGLAAKDPATHPLWGIPFALKDNIDLAGIPTTAGCTAFTYTPERHATVVARLIEAGAVPVGKANLDQFATGLNGTRSPFGACANSHDPDYVSGGSSAGSAVAVALGLASFSLGTDTAGSGRVPAGFNDLVGLKPSRGLVPTTGVVPACRSLDCVSVFAVNCDDANVVLGVVEGLDAADGYTRRNPGYNAPARYGRREGALRLAVPDESGLEFFGDEAYRAAYRATLARLEADDVELVPIDFTPFDEIARLLYEGPWVAERHVATEPLIEDDPDALFPVVRDIILTGATPLARDYFRAEYRLKDLAPHCLGILAGVDCLLTPTAGRLFTIAEMLAEPVRRNSELGHYTNFVNLLDLAAVAVPAGFTGQGSPFGVTLVADRFADRALLSIARRFEDVFAEACAPRRRRTTPAPPPRTTTGDAARIELLVCGAHLSGMALEHQLLDRGGRLVEAVATAPSYRLYALAGAGPPRPGLRHVGEGGASIEAEIWSLPSGELGDFIVDIPAPLGIGRVTLDSGREVAGFVCEERGFVGAEDITSFGGWRAWSSR